MDFEFRGTDRFEVLSWLGDGGMGVVYEARDRVKGSRVALKTLRELSPDAVLRLKAEFRALQDIQHPNLVTFGELIEDGGHWFMTMELLDGVHFLDWVRLPKPKRVRKASLQEVEVAPTEISDPTLPVPDAVGDEVTAPVDVPVLAAPTFDEKKLRSALRQLARGLAALHAKRKVHRDIKPSNLLVTKEGRLVVLDFGLVAETGPAQLTDHDIVGTAAYMAPEQAASRKVGAPADWYSVGTILFEALTGRLPFVGLPLEILMRKQKEQPPRPSALTSRIPADLEELCLELLALEPENRPLAAAILKRLGADEDVEGDTSSGVTSVAGVTSPLVGRAKELEILSEAYGVACAGSAVTVHVHGESGLGKSALVSHFVTQVEAEGALVLPGRCYERETVAYKAIDGMVHALARYLCKQPQGDVEAVLPRRTELLLQVFPELRRVEAAAQARRAAAPIRDPKELRARVFEAFRELLDRLSERRRVVMIVDDLQWADEDSLALLEAAMRSPGAPPVLLVTTLRTLPNRSGEAARHPASIALSTDAMSDVRHMQLGALSAEAARELARQLLRASGAPSSSPSGDARGAGPVQAPAVDVAALVKEAGGHPLFIDELVRHVVEHGVTASGRQRLEDALWARVQRLDPTTRRVLEIVAIAGAPTAEQTVARAAAMEPGEVARHLAALRLSNFARTTGSRADDTVEPFHDRIRETVVDYVDPDVRAQHHRRLALAFEAAVHPNPEALATHWHGAGEHGRAARYAEQAAGEATKSFAFDRAARLFRMAIDLGASSGDVELARAPLKQKLHRELGDALSNAGRGAEAGEAYLAAAPLGNQWDALELRRKAADALLRSGHIDKGIATIREVLRALGMSLPDSPQKALVSFLWNRAKLRVRGLGFSERHAGQIAPEVLRRLDACWSVGVGLALVDAVRGSDFQSRHLLLALKAGEPGRIAQSLAVEAGFAATAGGKGSARSRKLLEMANQLARKLDDPNVTAFTTVMEAITSFLEGRWQDTRDLAAQAEELIRDRCVGMSWEMASAQLFSWYPLAHLGEIGELRRLQPILARLAKERGDLYMATNLRVGHAHYVWLAADDPEAARAHSLEGLRQWTQKNFMVQHAFDFWGNLQVDLYQDDIESAVRRLDSHMPQVDESLLMRIQLVRTLMWHVRSRVWLASAARAPEGAERKDLLRGVERDAVRIAAEKMAWSTGLASALRGSAAALSGDKPAAAEHLTRAAECFDSAGMKLYAAAANRKRGELLGGEAGRLLIAAADAFMTRQTIKKPAKMAAMLVI